MTEELTPEEQQEFAQILSQINQDYPKQEEKVGLFHFFNKILQTKDSSKVANLGDEELNSVRALQRAKLFAKEMGYDLVEKYLQQRAEIILATSLSKNAAFIQAAITTKKESKTKIRTGDEKKKWTWGKKQEEQD